MAVMCDEAKQLFDAACDDFHNRLKRLTRYAYYTEIATRVTKALSWIYIPIAAAYIALCIFKQNVSLLLLGCLFGIVFIQFVISNGVDSAYKRMLKQCHELDCVAIAIRDLSANNPEWRKGSNIELIEAEVK